MSIGIQAILDKVASHAGATGRFERVNTHEFKSAPGKGVYCEIWCGPIVPATSGLASTSINLTLYIRVRSDMISEPQDLIDPRVVDAIDDLFTAYSGDFTLGDSVRNIELNTGLRADPGYLEQDNKMYRVMTITMPIIINDVYTQAP